MRLSDLTRVGPRHLARVLFPTPAPTPTLVQLLFLPSSSSTAHVTPHCVPEKRKAAGPLWLWVAYHAWGTEAARDAAHAHALQLVVLAGFGTLQPFSPWGVSRAHQFDHGRPAGQAPLALQTGRSKRPLAQEWVAPPSTPSLVPWPYHSIPETQSHPVPGTETSGRVWY